MHSRRTEEPASANNAAVIFGDRQRGPGQGTTRCGAASRSANDSLSYRVEDQLGNRMKPELPEDVGSMSLFARTFALKSAKLRIFGSIS